MAETERRFIVVDDRVCTDIELLPILEPGRLREILAGELVERGFEVDDGVAKRRDGDIELEVDLATARLSARLEREEEVERVASKTVRGTVRELAPEDDAKVRAELKEQVREELDADEARLQREVTAKLEAKLADVQAEVDQVVNRVAGVALKEKASQLGEIVELLEDESGSITIKVKV